MRAIFKKDIIIIVRICINSIGVDLSSEFGEQRSEARRVAFMGGGSWPASRQIRGLGKRCGNNSLASKRVIKLGAGFLSLSGYGKLNVRYKKGKVRRRFV